MLTWTQQLTLCTEADANECLLAAGVAEHAPDRHLLSGRQQ